MHELGIAEDLFRNMMSAAEAHGLRKVDRVVFKLGVLSGVEGGHLAEHLDEYSPGTPFEGTRYDFLDVQPGDPLTSEEAAKPSPGGQTVPATGFEIIIVSMEGH